MKVVQSLKLFNFYRPVNVMTPQDVSKTLYALSSVDTEDDEHVNIYEITKIIGCENDDDNDEDDDAYSLLHGMHVEADCESYFQNEKYDAWKNMYDDYLEEEKDISDEEFDKDVYDMYYAALINHKDE